MESVGKGRVHQGMPGPLLGTSKLGKEYNKALYDYLADLTSMQSKPAWVNHKLESRLCGEISTISYMQMISL